MFSISSLTSNRTKFIYIFVYIIYTLLYLINPLLLMKFINSIIDRQSNYIILFSILSVVNFILIQVFGFFLSCLVGKVENENYVNYFKRLNDIAKNYDTRTTNLSSDILSQFMGEYYEKTNSFFFIQKVELIFSIITVFAIFIIMFLIDWKIALVLLVFVPISFYITKKFEKKLYMYSLKNKENSDIIKKYVLDQFVLSKEERFSTIKQLPSIDRYLLKYKNDYSLSVKQKSKYLYFFSYSFLNLSILIVILLSGYLTYQGVLMVGTLFAFQNYTSQLWNPAEFLMSYVSKIQGVKPIIKSIEELFSQTLEDYDNSKIDNIRLDNFCVLDSNNNKLFNPINIKFLKGEIYLLRGKNGIGKSSMVEAVMGFNNRYNGDIYINDSKRIYSDFAYVSSDAYISDFYDSIKSKGSSGQKKLEQIKLYINQNKSVYILDEPTNFIDKQYKEHVINIIKEKASNDNIIIIISHDPIFESISTKIIDL